MKNWTKSIGGAVGMGFSWAFAGALAASLIEAFIDPHGTYVDVWAAALMYPGFLGGVIFFTLLRIAEGRRRLVEVSLPRAAIWGAASGLLLPALLALAIAVGFGDLKVPISELWLRAAVIIGIMMLAMAVAACVSVLLARSVEAARGGGPETGRM
jgi:hypothetical protein